MCDAVKLNPSSEPQWILTLPQSGPLKVFMKHHIHSLSEILFYFCKTSKIKSLCQKVRSDMMLFCPFGDSDSLESTIQKVRQSLKALEAIVAL